MSIGGHASQRPARIGCPNGGMRSGCCKPLFHHPGFHAGRETSTAGGHRLHRRDSPCCGGGMRQAVGGGPSAWVGRTGRLGCRDIFRLDQDGNVVERWDVLQTIPPAVSQRPHHVLTVTSPWRSVAGLLRYGRPRQRPRRAARAQDAPAAPGHRALCSQDPRAMIRTGTAAATAATAWVTAVEMCAMRARSTGAGEHDDELHMLWPGIGIGARRSCRDDGRPSERSHANTRRGQVRSARRRTVNPTGEADR
jgi:hypothetical protein